MTDGALNGFGVSGLAAFDESVTVMQDVPHDSAQPVGNGPDRFDISWADDQAFKDRLQMAPFGSGGGLSGLAQQAPQEAIALGGAARMVLSSALLRARANADPGG
jgi:hypothetical protein